MPFLEVWRRDHSLLQVFGMHGRQSAAGCCRAAGVSDAYFEPHARDLVYAVRVAGQVTEYTGTSLAMAG